MSLVVKYTCGCYINQNIKRLNGWKLFVEILIPKICPECDEGDYYKLYIGRNRYHIEGDNGLVCPDDPEHILIRMKGELFQGCLNGGYPMHVSDLIINSTFMTPHECVYSFFCASAGSDPSLPEHSSGKM